MTWHQTWMAVADAVALRSPCELAQVGAVIVDVDTRVVATGYNGPAARDKRLCVACPRRGWARDGDYSTCLTIHAEANALMFCDRREREGGSIYVTGVLCMDCAKLVANSGLGRCVMRVNEGEEHRDLEGVFHYLRSCGIRTSLWV
jgi:dCMP deaminase